MLEKRWEMSSTERPCRRDRSRSAFRQIVTSQGATRRGCRPAAHAVQAGEEFLHATLPVLDLVFNLARRLTTNRPDAEDLVQETYLRAGRQCCASRPGANRLVVVLRVHATWAGVLTARTTAVRARRHRRHLPPRPSSPRLRLG
jgi:hypothetical protein